ncbi:MAG: hypothetical protein P4L99_02680, partial [Chthoniobacter sp.]|nr:hypothetical protein [Chthoniobacter sp.]
MATPIDHTGAFPMVDSPLATPATTPHHALAGAAGLASIPSGSATTALHPATHLAPLPHATIAPTTGATLASSMSATSESATHTSNGTAASLLLQAHLQHEVGQSAAAAAGAASSLTPNDPPKENRARESVTIAGSTSSSAIRPPVSTAKMISAVGNAGSPQVGISLLGTEKDFTCSSGSKVSSTVAVALSSATPAASSVPVASAPASSADPSARPAAPAASAGAHLVDAAAQHRDQQARDVLEKKNSAAVRKAKPLPPRVQKDSATFREKFAQAMANTLAGAQQQHQGEASQAPIQARDAVCHCLVVDSTAVSAEMKVEVEKVLALTVQAAIEAHGRALFAPHIPVGDISSIYIPREAKVIHINFVSLAALGAALRHPSLPFLIRCGSTALSRWNHYTKACG